MLAATARRPGSTTGRRPRTPSRRRHRAPGIGQVVGAPIVVDGETVGLHRRVRRRRGGRSRTDSEIRLVDFTQLLATAISNIHGPRRTARPGGVAGRAAPGRDAGRPGRRAADRASWPSPRRRPALLGVGAVSLIRWDPDDPAASPRSTAPTASGQRSRTAAAGRWRTVPKARSSWRPAARSASTTGRCCPGQSRPGTVPHGFGQAVAAPIFIDGTMWGHIAAFGEAERGPAAGLRASARRLHPADGERHRQRRGPRDLRNLAERQGAALRRVATLVAQTGAAAARSSTRSPPRPAGHSASRGSTSAAVTRTAASTLLGSTGARPQARGPVAWAVCPGRAAPRPRRGRRLGPAGVPHRLREARRAARNPVRGRRTDPRRTARCGA